MLKGKVLKKFMCFVLAICMIALVQPKYVQASGNYTADWERWSQGASGYSAMQYGCRVTAYSKMLAEAGYTGFGNPDGFFEWGKARGYFRASDTCELTSLGVAPVTYVNNNGGTASLAGKQPLSGNKATDANTIMNLINQGYYVVLTCKQHSVYVGRQASISQGTAVILDSWKSRKEGPSFQYKNYSQYTFQNAYYFRITNNNHVSCNCSANYAGNYIVNTNTAPLNIRNSHGGGSVIGSIPKGATVYVEKGNGSWAHVTYNGVSGLCSMEWLSKVVEHETNPPVISNVQITWSSSNGYTVAAQITDDSGIDRVQFPTWTEANGQDDLDKSWGTNSSCSGSLGMLSTAYESGKLSYGDGKYIESPSFFDVKISDHNNERGAYITHIYAFDIYGNVSSYAVPTQIVPEPDTTAPVISNVKVTDITPFGYTVTADVSDDTEISRVQFPTWTEANGQDDLAENWEWNSACKGTIEDRKATFHVSINDHNLEAGKYVTHIYAYDKSGNVTRFELDEQTVPMLEDSAEDFGDDFHAEVRRITYNLYLTAGKSEDGEASDNKSAVYLDEKNNSDSQQWHFVKNPDGKSYTILSGLSGHALSAVDEVPGGSCPDNKVWTLPSDGSDGQSWYIVKWLNGYCFVPKLKWGDYIMMTGYGTNYSNNVLGMWKESNNPAWGARFIIEKEGTDEPSVPTDEFIIEENVNGEKMLASYIGDEVNVVIPKEITEISDNAFYGCSKVTSVEIPESVTRIGNGVFEGCDALKTIKGKKGSYAENYANENGYEFLDTSNSNSGDVNIGDDNANKDIKLSNPVIEDNSSMPSGHLVTWDCIYFGNYPQSEVTADVSVYTTLQDTTEWDADGNAEIDGVKYLRLQKDDEEIYHYFRYEPIKWRVLSTDGKQAFLLSDQILDKHLYNEKFDMDITWENCTVRSWLNGYGAEKNQAGLDYSSDNFINRAFDSSEQKSIITSSVKNDDNLIYGTDGGNDTEDKLFLLSESEAYMESAAGYGFAADADVKDMARRAESSDYAKAMGVYDFGYGGVGIWKLRSPGSANYHSAYVGYGDVYQQGCFNDSNQEKHGIRVALNLNLDNSENYKYAGTINSYGEITSPKPPVTPPAQTPDTKPSDKPSDKPSGSIDDNTGDNTNGETFLAGDVDCNKEVNLNDATIVLRIAVGIQPQSSVTKQGQKNADYDKSGKIDLKDATYTLKAAVGIKFTLPK